MFGKMALPHLGGAAAVWTTCMLFFQAALLVGYIYSHVVASLLKQQTQIIVHLVLLSAAVTTLPLGIPSGWAPSDPAAPIGALLTLMALRLGPAFVLLSAGSPLLQHWFAHARAAEGASPYPLYAASNLGSIVGLLAYPLAIEPSMRVARQSYAWAAGYIVVILFTAWCGVLAAPPALARQIQSSPVAAEPTPWRVRALWTVLAAVPSSLLLGVTTHLTTDLAPIPLLWVVPLVLYLLTFVIAFGEWRQFPVKSVLFTLPYLVLAVAALLFLQSEVPGPLGYGIHLATFFVAALACHTRLVAARPEPERLTEFYLCLAVGGALGGVFNVLVAPSAFHTVAEYPLALVAAVALSRPPAISGRWTKLAVPLAVACSFIVAAEVMIRTQASNSGPVMMLLAGVAAFAAFAFRARPLVFATLIGSFVLAGTRIAANVGATRFAARSFYGVYRVVDDSVESLRRFYSGTTIHGSEFLADSTQAPLAYYHREGPLGSLFSARSWHESPWRVAVVGLGAGATASYARPGESWTFYEIDPLVARIAADSQFFRFLSSAAAPQRIVLGDARISIAREPERAFDVLLIDAFSSDAIPVHLLTREALALYRSRVAEDGIIGWHISNKYLDLRPVLKAIADDAGLICLIRADLRVPEHAGGRLPSIWVAMTASQRTAAAIQADSRWIPLRTHLPLRLWRDDFSNVLGVLR